MVNEQFQKKKKGKINKILKKYTLNFKLLIQKVLNWK